MHLIGAKLHMPDVVIDVLVPNLSEWALPGAPTKPVGAHVAATLKHEWQRLAHMANDDLERRKAIEHAGGEELQDVKADIAMLPLAGRAKTCADEVGIFALEYLSHTTRGPRWVQIDGHI